MSPAAAQEVLAFWFEDIDPKAWFDKDETFDGRIRERFLDLYDAVSRSFDVVASIVSSDIALATAIVLDQFPRNMFRGTARAFESDNKALALAHAAVDRNLDAAVPASRRKFLYLPFEHSEALADQDVSVELFGGLGDAETLRYAEAHRAIIARFGRFPHRNAVLGRVSTPEEITFLAGPDSSF
jgi:uncharacterized protein (DUF924 family)